MTLSDKAALQRLEKRLERERNKRLELETFAEQKTQELYAEKEKIELIGQVISAGARHSKLQSALEAISRVLVDYGKVDHVVLFHIEGRTLCKDYCWQENPVAGFDFNDVEQTVWLNEQFQVQSREAQPLQHANGAAPVYQLVQKLSQTRQAFIVFGFSAKQRYLNFSSELLSVVMHELRNVYGRERDAELINRLDEFDKLTRLISPQMFGEKLDGVIESLRDKSFGCAVIALDIADMGLINSRYSMDYGNRLLQEIARQFAGLLRHHDAITRHDGDCFMFYLISDRPDDAVEGVLARIQERLRRSIEWEGEQLLLRFHIGISKHASIKGLTAERAIQEAVTALKVAKRTRQSPTCYEPSMTDTALQSSLMEIQLREALSNEEFVLFYQPIVNLAANDVVKAEALIRWQKGGKLISPVDFIPALEQSDLIIPVGRWVIQKALEDLKYWQSQGSSIKQVSVNVSINQLPDESLSHWVSGLLSKLGLPPESLVLEVTESLALELTESMDLFFQRFQALGIEIALDDFGTGYSSLSYLHRYPFTKLKIDRSFILNLAENQKSRNLLQSIVALSKSLELSAIAEGIETPEVSQLLHELGVEFGQGFLYSKPIASEAFLDYLLAGQPNDALEAHALHQGRG